MKVIQVKEQEDCFDGSIMKKVVLDTPVTKAFIDFMGQKGELSYFPSFARPFFKVEVKGHYFLKGIEDNSYITVTLYKNHPVENLNLLLKQIDEFSTLPDGNGPALI